MSHGYDNGLYGLSEAGFWHDVSVLLCIVIPAAIFYTCWRMFETTRARAILVLNSLALLMLLLQL